MLVSVLSGAALGGGAVLAINVFEALVGRGLTFPVFLSAFLESLLVAFLIFLTGFFLSVTVGAPLFKTLEKAKRRNAWPYLTAALIIAFAAFLFIYGGLPSGSDFELRSVTATFLPAVVIALIFARRMRPFWRAAERAEADIIQLDRVQ